ncbi:MAG: hypothetical protein M8354_01590 [Halalkalicoccus sp.]|nr:hypothetical protein [Halalkalicoccus sp.]
MVEISTIVMVLGVIPGIGLLPVPIPGIGIGLGLLVVGVLLWLLGF